MFIMEELVKSLTKKEQFVILIDGRAGSGKSTIARDLLERLNCDIHINLDEYTFDKTGLFDQVNIDKGFEIDFENTEYEVVRVLKDCRGSKKIIIEGCFSFGSFNFGDVTKVWVDVPKETAYTRLVQRELNDDGRKHISKSDIELSSIKWQEAEDRYIKASDPKSQAQFMIRN